MTQQELLADAARTEIENTASLKLLLAMEEATRKKAAIAKSKFMGPIVKLHSKKVGEEEKVREADMTGGVWGSSSQSHP